jgi:hypothetical protein
MAVTFNPKTTPMSHQAAEVAHYGDTGRAIYWEQGTGKSKDLIDNAAALYCGGEVGGQFVVAPNGLHRNFVTRELPKHLPDAVAEKSRAMFYRTDKGATGWHKDEGRDLLRHKGFTTLAMSYDALLTENGRNLAREYLTTRRCIYGADEAARFANPETERAKMVLRSGKLAPYRRVLSGTPIKAAPWDIHSQLQFCDPEFWKPLGLNDYEGMKNAFGVWGKNRIPIARTGKRRFGVQIDEDGSEWRMIPKLLKYKDLDLLQKFTAPMVSRVLKADVLDLPDKVYTRHEFELSLGQRQAYDSLRNMGFAEVGDAAATASMRLVQDLRLQQISCGYLPTDPELGEDAQPVHRFSENPRLDLLQEIVAGLDHQFIIWARFRLDHELIAEMLAKIGVTFALYNGSLNEDERAENEDRFHRGEAQGFLATQACGGEGLTLTEAKTAIFYSQSFKLIERLQAEDRPHRYGQTSKVNNIDLVAYNSKDDDIIDNLQGKFETAGTVLGDKARGWIGNGGQIPLDLVFGTA